MFFIRSKAIIFLLGGMICLIPIKRIPLTAFDTGQDGSLTPLPTEKVKGSDENKGYKDITAYKDQFLAVGTDGRIDLITESGGITSITNTLNVNLNSAIYYNQTIIAVGNSGTILVSTDGQTCRKIESGTEKNINGITSFNGGVIAVADQGTVLIQEDGNNWRTIQLPLNGDIVSVSAGISFCIGVTNKGEIIKTSDGIRWDIFDYNSNYAGYYKPCSFKEVLLTDNTIAIIGQHEDGSPVALFSSLGNVWTERSLNYTDDNGMIQIVTNLPNDLCYDTAGDQFFLGCENGEVLALPSCNKCNESFTTSETNIRGIICSENTLLIVGDDYYVKTINLR